MFLLRMVTLPNQGHFEYGQLWDRLNAFVGFEATRLLGGNSRDQLRLFEHQNPTVRFQADVQRAEPDITVTLTLAALWDI
jgi:hypothetical protein